MIKAAVIILLLLLFGLLIFFEWKKGGKRLILRSIAIFLSLISLYFLLFPPGLIVNKKKQTFLFVNGTNVEIPDSLNTNNLTIIENLDELNAINESIKPVKLIVVGNGLKSKQLQKVRIPIEFIPLNPSQHIQAINAYNLYTENEINISGSLNLKDTLQLFLESEEIKQKKDIVGELDFSFFLTLDDPGQYLFNLHGIKDQDTIFKEKLAFYVKDSKALSCMVLTQNPSFELRYLLDFLSEKGSQIAMRQQLSADIFHTEFINLPEMNLSVINEELLEQIDLLVTDQKSFDSWSNNTRKLIFSYIENGKIGLFFTDISKELIYNGLKVANPGKVTENLLKGANDSYLIPFQDIQIEKASEVYFNDLKLGSHFSLGLGKIGVSNIVKTYPLILNGESKLYSTVWKKLLQPLTLKNIEDKYYYSDFINWRFNEMDQYESAEALFESGYDSLWIKYEQTLLPDFVTLKSWPQSTGWQGKREHSPFIYDKEDWTGIQNKIDSIQTIYHFIPSNNYAASTYKKQLPEWIFFISFLVLIGFIWLHEKLSE